MPLFMLIIPRMPGFIMFGFTIPFIWLNKNCDYTVRLFQYCEHFGHLMVIS